MTNFVDVDLTVFASDFQDKHNNEKLRKEFLGNPIVQLFRKMGFLDDGLELRFYSYRGWYNDIFFAYEANETNMWVGYGTGTKYR